MTLWRHAKADFQDQSAPFGGRFFFGLTTRQCASRSWSWGPIESARWVGGALLISIIDNQYERLRLPAPQSFITISRSERQHGNCKETRCAQGRSQTRCKARSNQGSSKGGQASSKEASGI